MSKPVEMIDFLVDGSKTHGQTDTKTDVDNCLSGVTHHEKFQVSRHSGDLPICTEISLPLLRFFSGMGSFLVTCLGRTAKTDFALLHFDLSPVRQL